MTFSAADTIVFSMVRIPYFMRFALNTFTILASVGICCANSIVLARSSFAQSPSYNELTGYCEFNGKIERCFIKEIGVGLHKVTWLSDGVQATYAETNQGSYVK